LLNARYAALIVTGPRLTEKTGVHTEDRLFTLLSYADTPDFCSLKPDAAPMPVVKVEPTDEYPVPYDTSDEELDAFADKLASIGNTAELLESLGAPIETTKGTLTEEAALIDKAVSQQSITPLKSSLPAALGAAAFLKAYGQSRALDVDQVRAAITNKLMEIADCGDTKYELKALELLGKHSDIGLFTERSEITVNYNNPDNLEAAIKERVKRLLNADVVDIKPLGMDLEEELGLTMEDGEFSDIDEEEEESDD
jgi:hypothetical protein